MTRPAGRTWILAIGIILLWLIPSSGFALEEGEEEEGVSELRDLNVRKSSRSLDVVQHRAFYKGHRLELFPHLYATVLNNSFANRFLVISGASGAYHFSESFFVEGLVDFFPDYPFMDDLKSLNLAIAEYVAEGENIPDVPKEQLVASFALGFSPIYGKINLVSSYVQNFDISFVGGAGVLLIREDAYQVGYDVDTDRTVLVGPQEQTPNLFISPSAGLTTRFFLNRWLTLRADARFHAYIQEVMDYLHPVNQGQTVTFNTKLSFKTSMILSVGLSGFFNL